MVMVQGPGASFMPSGPTEKRLIWFALWLTLVATAGCDASMPSSSSTPRGEVRTEKLKTNLTADELRDLAQPASSTPGLSVDVQNAQSAAVGNENFNGDMQPKGLNTRLFGTASRNDDERFERLETVVQQLRDDFDAVSPAINRLVSIEREIQMLVDQLQVLVENDGNPSPAQIIPPVSAAMLEENVQEFPQENPAALSSPVPLAPPLAEVTPAPVPQQDLVQAPVVTPPAQKTPDPVSATSSDATLTNVRVADHDKTTRVVFESNKNISYTASVDPEKILLVTFAQGSAAENIAASSTKSSLIKSIDQTPQNSGGFIVAMPLAKSTKIVRHGVLQPDGTNKNYRIYIDLER